MPNLQNFKSVHLYSLLALSVSLLGSLHISACKSPKAPTSITDVPSNQEEEQLSMSVNKLSLQGREVTIKLSIKGIGSNQIVDLENFKLKAEFVEELTSGSDISYKNVSKQKQIVKNINKPLTEFIEINSSGSGTVRKTSNKIITLHLIPSKQAYKLRLKLELLDNQDNSLQTLEVVWRKGALLVYNLDEFIGEAIANFALNNATDTPLEPDKIELSLISTNEVTCQFVKTNTSKAILGQLLSNPQQILLPDIQTEPITLQVIDNPKGKTKSTITLTITQDEGKTKLATQKIGWKQDTTAISKGKIDRAEIKKPKEPTIKSKQQTDIQPPNKEEKYFATTTSTKEELNSEKEEVRKLNDTFTTSDAAPKIGTQKKVNTQPADTQLDAHPPTLPAKEKDTAPIYTPNLYLSFESRKTQKGEENKRLKFWIENQGEELSQEALNNVTLRYTIKGEGDLNDVKLKRRKNTIEVNGAKVSSFLRKGIPPGQKEGFELIIESGNVDIFTIEIFLEGVQNPNPITITWNNPTPPLKHKKE